VREREVVRESTAISSVLAADVRMDVENPSLVQEFS
jgi:hypothetical protein